MHFYRFSFLFSDTQDVELQPSFIYDPKDKKLICECQKNKL